MRILVIALSLFLASHALANTGMGTRRVDEPAYDRWQELMVDLYSLDKTLSDQQWRDKVEDIRARYPGYDRFVDKFLQRHSR